MVDSLRAHTGKPLKIWGENAFHEEDTADFWRSEKERRAVTPSASAVLIDPKEIVSFLRSLPPYGQIDLGPLDGISLNSASNEIVLRKFDPLTVSINSLWPSSLKLISPIAIIVQGVDGDFEANFFDANIGASGATQQEAVDNIKDMIVMSYESLAEEPLSQLGPLMKKQKAVLEQYIAKRVD